MGGFLAKTVVFCHSGVNAGPGSTQWSQCWPGFTTVESMLDTVVVYWTQWWYTGLIGDLLDSLGDLLDSLVFFLVFLDSLVFFWSFLTQFLGPRNPGKSAKMTKITDFPCFPD